MRDSQPAPARYPTPVKMQAGETRHWCGCGHTDHNSMPFCTDPTCPADQRLPYTAERDEIALFCGCHGTRTAPICDGAHAGLKRRAPWWRRLGQAARRVGRKGRSGQ